MRGELLEFVIKSLSKKIGKLITDDDLKSLQKDFFHGELEIKKFYKLIFNLKQRQYLIPLKKDLYIISYPENRDVTISSVIDKLYWKLLHKQITNKCKKSYYIGSTKGLELYLNNFTIPNEIEIYSNNQNGGETIVSDYTCIFKNYPMVKNTYQSKSKNVFQICTAKRNTITIENNEFFLGPIEVCVLESLYYTDKTTSGYQNDLIKKCIKKYKSKRDRNLIKEIISSGKHHTSLNRLFEICKEIDVEFTKSCEMIIKTVGFKISFSK